MALNGKVALITGASRGIGKGIALTLGEAGATVYVTGRTVAENEATVPLEGTITQTAEEVTRLGGTGVAVRCDHNDDAQVEAVFEQIQREQGRLDVLVNNAWAGYEGYHKATYGAATQPFWEKPLSYWDENLVGVRWAYVASVFAARQMTRQSSGSDSGYDCGCIFNLSFKVDQPGNPAYAVAKSATDRLTSDMAEQLRPHSIPVVSLHPGLVRTEGVMLWSQYFDLSNSQSSQFTGRAVLALLNDVNLMQKTGKVLNVARLAQEYDFDDIDGKRPHPE